MSNNGGQKVVLRGHRPRSREVHPTKLQKGGESKILKTNLEFTDNRPSQWGQLTDKSGGEKGNHSKKEFLKLKKEDGNYE